MYIYPKGVTLLHLVVSNKELFPVFREIVEEHNFALGIKELTSIVPVSVQAAAEAEHDDGVTEHAVKKGKANSKEKQTTTTTTASTKKSKVSPTPNEKGSPKKGGNKGSGASASALSHKMDKLRSATQAVIASNAFEDAEEKHKAALHRMRWRRTLHVNATNGDGNTPLNVALYNKNRDAAMVFLLGFHCQCDLNRYSFMHAR
jgi:hypothetical protein